MTEFLTLAETARVLGVPVSRISQLVVSGHLVPAGRAGSNANSPILFLEEDIPAIQSALENSNVIAPRFRPHLCKDTAEIRAKYDAFRRAESQLTDPAV
jgi:hypothetical protein